MTKPRDADTLVRILPEEEAERWARARDNEGILLESRRKARRVFRNAFVLPGDGRASGFGDLYVDGPVIQAVTPWDLAPSWPDRDETQVDLTGHWLLPGFVQTHVHLCQTLFRGLAERRRLERWLAEVIWPLEAALDASTLAVSAELAVRQLLAGGTTTVLDMGTTHDTDAIAEVCARLGIRAILAPAFMDRGPDAAAALLAPASRAMAELERFAARWEGHDDGRLRVAVAPRFVPSVSDAFFRELVRWSRKHDCVIHTHGSETRAEIEMTRTLTGHTPPGYYARLSGAEGRIKMAHGVWLSGSDREELRASGTSVTHCPSSNLKLGSGLADLPALLSASIPVGLGADGAACNNRLDAWEEMRLAALSATAARGPEAIRALDCLELATSGGARVLGMESEIGSLAAGKRADFVVLDPTSDPACAGADPRGLESPEDLLVFAGSSRLVRETWIDGRKVYDRASTAVDVSFDHRVREARTRLLDRARKGGFQP